MLAAVRLSMYSYIENVQAGPEGTRSLMEDSDLILKGQTTCNMYDLGEAPVKVCLYISLFELMEIRER